MADHDGNYRSSARYFDSQAAQYDAWFDKHRAAFESELLAVRRALTGTGRGIEIGVGTGRFAASLGITVGIDPSVEMGMIARRRGIAFVCGIAEQLPFGAESFDLVLMANLLLFLNNPAAVIRESHRVLRSGGEILTAFIDRNSFLAQYYEREKSERGAAYHFARFLAVDEVESMLTAAGFGGLTFFQTIYSHPEEIVEIQEVEEGHGDGAFVVVRALKR